MINALRPLIFQIVGSIAVAVIISAFTTSFTLSMRTKETETTLSVMKERLASMEARISATDRAQAALEGRLVRLEVSLDQIKDDTKEMRRLLQAIAMRPSVRKNMEDEEVHR